MAARRAKQISLKDCYEILRLQKGASLQDLKAAYRKRAFELHPDLHPGDPDANKQFQLLNEAYVALSAILKPADETKEKSDAKSGAKPETGESKNAGSAGKRSTKEQDATAAYAEQDVLRDLLNDPFARRVFEDIYSELSKKQAKPETPPPPPPPPPGDASRSVPPPRKEPSVARSAPQAKHQDKGITGAVKDFLLDEKQTITMPAARLVPGAKIRLQIRKGLTEDVTAVEVTLPRDFVVGKPMRLRGLGKRVGPWQGDLYLTILTQ